MEMKELDATGAMDVSPFISLTNDVGKSALRKKKRRAIVCPPQMSFS
jgi:hypothetical protein